MLPRNLVIFDVIDQGGRNNSAPLENFLPCPNFPLKILQPFKVATKRSFSMANFLDNRDGLAPHLELTSLLKAQASIFLPLSKEQVFLANSDTLNSNLALFVHRSKSFDTVISMFSVFLNFAKMLENHSQI